GGGRGEAGEEAGVSEKAAVGHDLGPESGGRSLLLARGDPQLAADGEIRQAVLQADRQRVGPRLHRGDEREADLAGSEAELERPGLDPPLLATIDRQPAIAEMVRPRDAGPLGVWDRPALQPPPNGAARRPPHRPGPPH